MFSKRMVKKMKKKKKNVSQPQLIKMTDLIDSLRSQLIEHDATRDEDFQPLFKIKDATVEANVVVETEIGAEGGMNFYLARIGAKASETSGSSFKMAITLEPLDNGAGPLVAGSKS